MKQLGDELLNGEQQMGGKSHGQRLRVGTAFQGLGGQTPQEWGYPGGFLGAGEI